LHPKAQSELTKFLALVASCGVQVFIESHSEHVLNAIRVVTLQKEIDIKNDEVSVLYFQNDKKEPFVHLKIDEKGKINNWVDGFFDQQELDLGEIFKLSRKK
jgi:predicted ATPase